MDDKQHEIMKSVLDFAKTTMIFAYEPAPPMQPFIEDTSKRIILRAANRIGKTYAGCFKLAKYMLENPGCRCRVVGSTYRQVNDRPSAYLYEFLAPWLSSDSSYSLTRGFANQVFTLRNGSLCQLRSNQQEAITHAGDSMDVVLMDEVPEQDVLAENMTRTIDRNGSVWLTLTPIGKPIEYLRELVESDEGSIWQHYVIPFTHEACPWLPPEYVEQCIADAKCDPLTYEQKINGAWEGATVDRLFVGLSDKNYFTKLPGDLNWRVMIGTDHGELSGNQVACLCLVHPNQEDVYLLDEYQSQRGTTPDEDALHITNMLQRQELTLYDVDQIVGDIGSGGKLQPGTSVNRLLTEGFAKVLGIPTYQLPEALRVRKPNKRKGSVSFGERMINTALVNNNLFIHEDCVGYKKALSHYQGQAELKHWIDALRYIATPIFEKQYNKRISKLMIRY
jgi:phage terminase large subunit-like protein